MVTRGEKRRKAKETDTSAGLSEGMWHCYPKGSGPLRDSPSRFGRRYRTEHQKAETAERKGEALVWKHDLHPPLSSNAWQEMDL